MGTRSKGGYWRGKGRPDVRARQRTKFPRPRVLVLPTARRFRGRRRKR